MTDAVRPMPAVSDARPAGTVGVAVEGAEAVVPEQPAADSESVATVAPKRRGGGRRRTARRVADVEVSTNAVEAVSDAAVVAGGAAELPTAENGATGKEESVAVKPPSRRRNASRAAKVGSDTPADESSSTADGGNEPVAVDAENAAADSKPRQRRRRTRKAAEDVPATNAGPDAVAADAGDAVAE